MEQVSVRMGSVHGSLFVEADLGAAVVRWRERWRGEWLAEAPLSPEELTKLRRWADILFAGGSQEHRAQFASGEISLTAVRGGEQVRWHYEDEAGRVAPEIEPLWEWALAVSRRSQG